MKDEALHLALEALNTAHLAVEDDMLADEIHQAITAIKQALTAQPAPVAWAEYNFKKGKFTGLTTDDINAVDSVGDGCQWVPQLQALAAQPVQGLPFGVGGGLVAIKTLLGRDPCVHANTAIEMIDAILKEHLAAQPAVQEPVLMFYEYKWEGKTSKQYQWLIDPFELPTGTKLYTTPPAAPVQEPIGYLFQHEETGLTTVVDVQQVEWGFEKNNPRHQKIGPVYTTPPAAQPAPTVQEPDAHNRTLRHRIRVHIANREHYSKVEFLDKLHEILHESEQTAQPAVPDAITDDSESPEYRTGWNDCRQAMMEMKP
jgi:hypothetical protein